MSTCWPGRCPSQWGTCSNRLLTRNVSFMISRTSASCHSRRRPGAPPTSITVVPLLFPGVAIVVVTQRLPETTLILFHESQSSQPLRAFPKIEVRHEEPGRTTMLGRNRRALIAGHDQTSAANEIGNRKVRCVTSIAMGHDVRFGRFCAARRSQQRVKCHSLPSGIELRPFRNTVNVGPDGSLRERVELLPIPTSKQ